ncbi:MAG: ATP-binding protein [Moorea sp. SIO2B7]|nr:ATP-binding protein [Moorena sp. SIO2B7]
MSEDIITLLYNSFNPFQPLPAGDPKYVDCREVRGNTDIIEDLGNRIRISDDNTCHLYSGHRGGGKSTELRRLKKYLEENNFFVIYFEADEEDIQSEDAQYTDILLACTRHLLADLYKIANPNKLLNWVNSRVKELKDIAQTELYLEGLSVEAQIAQVAKITANLRAEPNMRQEIRDKVNPHTVSLIDILNEYLKEAKEKLPNNCNKLAMIVDNLDRIVPIIQESGRTNHEEIFIDRFQQLQALDCHLIYTVPISLLYSHRANDIQANYNDAIILPMVMVRTPDDNKYDDGLDKIQQLIGKRFGKIAPKLSLETEIFHSKDTLRQMCLMSGGHIRDLMHLMQNAISGSSSLPITKTTVRKSISKLRDVYRRSVNEQQWELLAEIYRYKRIINDNKYRDLLFNRCLLEYCYWDEEYELKRWCDVHPLIRGIPEFKEAVARL